MIEEDDYDPDYWREVDEYYDSARSLFNDISIVVSIIYDYHGVIEKFLFPGDLTDWSILLPKYRRTIRNCILKIPHHGGKVYCNPPYWYRSHYGGEECCNPLYLCRSTLLCSSCPFSNNIYGFLMPEIALIYPFERARLPKLSVLNQIIIFSKTVFCTYRKGIAKRQTQSPSASCVKCYNCVERDKSVILKWKKLDSCNSSIIKKT